MKRADLVSLHEGSFADERRLVSEVVAKDRKATAEFVALCADWAYPFVRSRLMPRVELAEDMVQEILLAAWQNLPKFRGDSGLRQWILGIARHKLEDYYRKHVREAALQDEDGQTEQSATTNFENQLEAADRQKQVDQVLAVLPEVYSIALIWRYREGRSIREIAQETGKTEKAIERLLARAREMFKRRWNDAVS